MNKSFFEAEELIADIADALENMELTNTEVVICPPSVYLEMATDIAEESNIKVGAQNVNDNDSGAFTGEISAFMLQSMEVGYCIIGHSERRKYFSEDSAFLKRKVDAMLDHEIRPAREEGHRPLGSAEEPHRRAETLWPVVLDVGHEDLPIAARSAAECTAFSGASGIC